MKVTGGHFFSPFRVSCRAAHDQRAPGRSVLDMRAAAKAILISVVLATVTTSASAEPECITSLPAKRDVHWYYYVRKSDGAHCWYPGSQEARAAARGAAAHESKPQPQSKPAIKPVAATERPPTRKAAKAEAEARLNAIAAELEPAPPETPAETIGTRWPGTNLSLDGATARREVPQRR
jgi:hypothetical protein